MFTGIIENTAKVISTNTEKLVINRPKDFTELFIGQSISTNGACLSVSQFDEKTISFDVLSETFRKTNLGKTSVVNLERAMPANGRFEGHIVLGHVDGKIMLQEMQKEDSGTKYIFSLPPEKKFLVSKGSICLNGTSLTIGEINEKTFSVYLIPLTLQDTNLGNLQKNDEVNFEYDYLAKIITASS